MWLRSWSGSRTRPLRGASVGEGVRNLLNPRLHFGQAGGGPVRLAPQQPLEFPGRGAHLRKSIRPARTSQPVKEHRQVGLRPVIPRRECRQTPLELGDARRAFRVVFPAQFPERVGNRIAHGSIPKRSNASAAAATKAGAVLQCPRTSVPTRAAITALRSSTTATSG